MNKLTTRILSISLIWLCQLSNAEPVGENPVLKFTSTDSETYNETCFLLQEEVKIDWEKLISTGATNYPSNSFLTKNLWKYKSGITAHFKFNAPLPDSLKDHNYFVIGKTDSGVVKTTHLKGIAIYRELPNKNAVTGKRELSLEPEFGRPRLCFNDNGGVQDPLFVAKIDKVPLPVRVKINQIDSPIDLSFEESESKKRFSIKAFTHNFKFSEPKKIMFKDGAVNKYLAISYPNTQGCREEWQMIHIGPDKPMVLDYKGGGCD